MNARFKDEHIYLEIRVVPSEVPISLHGVYHYRTGGTKQELKGAALQQFLLNKLGKSWDDMAVDNSSLDDIDESVVRDFVTRAVKTNRTAPVSGDEPVVSVLRSLHLICDDGRLKAAAILLFGKSPLQFFPHAYFKIGRFGETDHDLKFQDVIEGNIFQMFERVLELLRTKYLQHKISYENFQRVETLDYPEDALREAVLNAIVHKFYGGTSIQLSVYDDRLMLWNPGSLADELRLEDLKEKHASHPRNRKIADVFFKAGFIEAWGRGIAKMIDSCKAQRLPVPEFRLPEGGFQVTFYKDRYTAALLADLGLNARQVQLVTYLKKSKKVTNRDYQGLYDVSRNTATIDLQDLVTKGILARFGRGAGVYYSLVGI